jgi:hypothetical protein
MSFKKTTELEKGNLRVWLLLRGSNIHFVVVGSLLMFSKRTLGGAHYFN